MKMYAWCCQQKHKSDIIVCLINITLLFYANILRVSQRRWEFTATKNQNIKTCLELDITANRNIPGPNLKNHILLSFSSEESTETLSMTLLYFSVCVPPTSEWTV